jgi:hypothetical protein
MNMIDFLAQNNLIELIVITTKKRKGNHLNTYQNANVRIRRPAKQSARSIERYLNYFWFYLSAFSLLLKYKPAIVWYFETLSSWPALIYKKLKKQRVSLMVHYHEYTESLLYEQGMFLAKWFHKKESGMYKNFSWISHTNPVRIELFKRDNNLQNWDPSLFHVIPNYPSEKWLQPQRENLKESKLKKLVFVGSLGYKNMYLQEVVDWLDCHKSDFTLDVYSYNIDPKAKEVLLNRSGSNIRYCGGCDYQSLAEILKNYDIGLVIYKPFSQNTIHAVSNKVFEYLACGLDVWFSEDMTHTFEYQRLNAFPKVLPVNFKNLQAFDYEKAISREGLSYQPSTFFYENIYPEIVQHILAN